MSMLCISTTRCLNMILKYYLLPDLAQAWSLGHLSDQLLTNSMSVIVICSNHSVLLLLVYNTIYTIEVILNINTVLSRMDELSLQKYYGLDQKCKFVCYCF